MTLDPARTISPIPINQAERLILEQVTAQNEADCYFGGSHDAVHGQTWTAERQVRGDFLSKLCLWIFGSASLQSRIVTIRGARITGPSDLSELNLPMLTLKLKDCRFDWHLDISSSHLSAIELNGCWVPWLDGQGAVIDKNFSMEKMTSSRALVLDGMSIGGDWDCDSSVIGDQHPSNCDSEQDNQCNVILYGQDMQVGGTLYLTQTNFSGGVHLTGTKIGGDLDCSQGEFHGYGNKSLNLEKITVGGQILFSDGFESYGPLWINNAFVKNGIDASGGFFRNSELPLKTSNIYALWIENSNIQGESKFDDDFDSTGLSLRNSEFGSVQMLGAVNFPGLDLRGAKARKFTDSKGKWPPQGTLHLNGFIYEEIEDDDTTGRISVADRLKWLGLYPGESPQPYMQLAKVLRERGEDEDATVILKEMQAKVVQGRMNGLDKFQGELLAPFGYGYHPENAIIFLLCTTGLGWIIYRRSFLAGKMTPTEADAYRHFRERGEAPPHYVKFSSLIYSLENTFPLVTLGQASKWQPDPNPADNIVEGRSPKTKESSEDAPGSPIVTIYRKVLQSIDSYLTPPRLHVFLWIQILVGWLLATLFVAGVTGIVRH
ncbi:hypothetical protein ACFPT7_14210 [Acidicapsa dinghuensis]|uniref:Uncharacterized protein n=1 Tax=Acidicapsa dinghuensis TaxID=2218256 RepID=A0ABW1EJJ7_9BACT|nr:hypothetical protein [Acidicapsa dinghuensis]